MTQAVEERAYILISNDGDDPARVLVTSVLRQLANQDLCCQLLRPGPYEVGNAASRHTCFLLMAANTGSLSKG
jgi:hypothetical protein